MKITPTFINFNKEPGTVATVTKDLTKYLYEYVLPELEEKLDGVIDEVCISIEKTKKGFAVLFATRYKNKSIIIKENSNDFYYIVPKATKIFTQKVLKYRDKFMDAKKQQRFLNKTVSKNISIVEDIQANKSLEKDSNDFDVKKIKQFHLKPMAVEEAILQMELLGHTFFLYLDIDTEENRVVYKRKNDTYGLIEARIG